MNLRLPFVIGSEKKNRVLFFINRRGYSFFVQCSGCGFIFQCPSCSVSLTLHKTEGPLMSFETHAKHAPSAVAKAMADRQDDPSRRCFAPPQGERGSEAARGG